MFVVEMSMMGENQVQSTTTTTTTQLFKEWCSFIRLHQSETTVGPAEQAD